MHCLLTYLLYIDLCAALTGRHVCMRMKYRWCLTRCQFSAGSLRVPPQSRLHSCIAASFSQHPQQQHWVVKVSRPIWHRCYGQITLKDDMQRFLPNWLKVVSSCLLQYKPVCITNFDKLCCKMLKKYKCIGLSGIVLLQLFPSCVMSYQDTPVLFALLCVTEIR